MPAVAVHAPGTPSWVDLASTDPAAATDFYSKVFGWTRFDVPDPDAGGYGMFLRADKQVAGVGPVQAEGQPPAWTTYVATDDAAKSAEKAKQAGGTVLFGPIEVMNAGSMAIIADPAGAVFGVWQSGEHKGAELLYETGSMGWSELNLRGEASTVAGFYKALFGWDAADATTEPDHTYTVFKLDGKDVAGVINMNEIPMIPAEVPPHWLAYFVVADCDAAAAAARDAGATINAEPRDISEGRFAVITDPQGAVFAIIQPRQR